MAIIDQILIPTDFSESSEKAYLLAKKLALSGTVKIDMLHVIPNIVMIDEMKRELSSGLPDLEKELYPLIFNEAELKLKSLMKDFFPYPARGEIYVKVDKKPSDAVTEHALNGNYSMIIMSAKGKDESGMFRGSTTEQVLRTSKVPVLSVYTHPDSIESGNIVVPTDGSLLSMTAIPAAVQFASLFNASITLLFVNELFGFIKTPLSENPNGNQGEKTTKFLINRLSEFIDEIKPADIRLKDTKNNTSKSLIYQNHEIPVFFEMISGFSAHNEIRKFANRSADLVMMTTHGRSGLAHMILGSNAEKVALNVEKTVLTIRPDSKLFAKQNN